MAGKRQGFTYEAKEGGGRPAGDAAGQRKCRNGASEA